MATNGNPLTDHLDLWTSALLNKSTAGRGSNGKQEAYGIKKLRELILELAVRGKLVPQDPNDEPASVLLEKIEKERRKLISDGRMKKLPVLPELDADKKSITLPCGWTWGFVTQVVVNEKYAIKRGPFGSAIRKDFFVPNGYKIYEQQNAIRDDFSLGDYYINEDKFNELKAFEVKPNDVIISCSGTVGKVAVAPYWMEPGVINQALLKLSLNESALTNDYFKLLFPTYYMKTETLSELQGTAQKNMVSVETLKGEAFPLPPLAEQRRIVAKVDELMALCDRLEQQQAGSLEAHQTLVETLLGTLTQIPVRGASVEARPSTGSGRTEIEEAWTRIADQIDTLFTTEHSIDQLKQTILQLAVMGKLVPQDPNDEPASLLLEKITMEQTRLIEDGLIRKQPSRSEVTDQEKPHQIPASWEWVRLTDVYYSISPSGRKLKTSEIINEGTYPVIDQGQSYIAGYTNEPNLLIVIPGPVVVFGDHTTEIKYIDFDFVAGADGTKILRPYLMCERFFYTYLKSYKLENRGYARHFKVLNENLMALPPHAEQHRIVAKVDELMALCDTLKARLKAAQTTQINLADAIVELAAA